MQQEQPVVLTEVDEAKVRQIINKVDPQNNMNFITDQGDITIDAKKIYSHNRSNFELLMEGIKKFYPLYVAGYIHPFASDLACRKLLMFTPPNTVLLRVSGSEKGKIVAVCMKEIAFKGITLMGFRLDAVNESQFFEELKGFGFEHYIIYPQKTVLVLNV